jgi:hypothetical protein
MATLKHIDVISASKIAAVIYAIIGLVLGVLIFIFANAFASLFIRSRLLAVGIGALVIIVLPIFLFIIGFIAITIEAWIYNLLADKFGGIKIDIKKNQLKRIDAMSAGKIYSIGGAIIGFIIGIIVAIVSLVMGSTSIAVFGVASIVLFPVIFAIILFISAVIVVFIYNYIAMSSSGIMLWFKGNELRSVGSTSYAKIQSIFGAIAGLIEGIRYAIFSSIHIAAMPISAFASSLGLGSIIVYPIIYFILAFIVSFVVAWLYNMLVKKIGGIKVVIS